MYYYKKCARYFGNAEALLQHLEASSHHAVYFPYVQTTTSTQEMSSAFSCFKTQAAPPRDNEPSKILMSSLAEYNHFALVVLPSLELVKANNIL